MKTFIDLRVLTRGRSFLLVFSQDAFLAKPIKLELLSQRLLEAYEAISQRQNNNAAGADQLAAAEE